MRNLFANVCLVLVSCAVGLALCEVSLRLFYPKYRHLAEAQFRSDAMRIWANMPNSRYWRAHPDTLVLHSLHHNNFALRQHRNFNEADLASATNIGVFGASFVENVLMAAPYSFTEPLDYLLNRSGKPFNVLNFGVDGYGPGQSLLHYEHFRYAEDLDHVFFVYSHNDLQNLSAKGLFHLDDAGQLVRNEGIRKTWWAPLLRRLHTAYLVLDVSERGLPSVREGDRNQKTPVAIFRQMIRYWKHLVEHRGGTFSVVLLPVRPEPVISDLLTAEDVEVIDLYECFGDTDPVHPRRLWAQSSPYRFRNDSHWNEAGNRLAAVCLYRVLEEKMNIPPLSEDRLREVIFQYYVAFGDESPRKAAEGGGRRTGLSGDGCRDSGEIPGD